MIRIYGMITINIWQGMSFQKKRLSDNGRNASDGCAVMQPLRIIIERKPAAVRKTLI